MCLSAFTRVGLVRLDHACTLVFYLGLGRCVPGTLIQAQQGPSYDKEVKKETQPAVNHTCLPLPLPLASSRRPRRPRAWLWMDLELRTRRDA